MLEGMIIIFSVMGFVCISLYIAGLACILGYKLLKYLFINSLAFFRGGYLQVTQGEAAVRAYQKRLKQGKYL